METEGDSDLAESSPVLYTCTGLPCLHSYMRKFASGHRAAVIVEVNQSLTVLRTSLSRTNPSSLQRHITRHGAQEAHA